jgi:hypothetical protein
MKYWTYRSYWNKQLSNWSAGTKVICDSLHSKACYKNASLFAAAGVKWVEMFFLHYLLCCDIVITGSGVEVCKLCRHELSEDSVFPVPLTKRSPYLQLTPVTACYCRRSPYRQSLQKPGEANITLFVAGWSISCQGSLWPCGKWRMIREDLWWRVGEIGYPLLRGDVLFGNNLRYFVTLDLKVLSIAADCEESFTNAFRNLLKHVVFSHISHFESKTNLFPQLIFSKYLRYLLRVVSCLITCIICSEKKSPKSFL